MANRTIPESVHQFLLTSGFVYDSTGDKYNRTEHPKYEMTGAVVAEYPNDVERHIKELLDNKGTNKVGAVVRNVRNGG